MGSAAARGTVLRRSWDRFALPWPFTRVAVVLGAPLDPAAPDADARLGHAIERANAAARAALF
jgi:lysophospholipid acyltransferase (LPLAT)-like uncharacterized protein